MNQQQQALERANQTRACRATMKREIRDGETRIYDVVNNLPWYAKTMKLEELIKAQNYWGTKRTRKFLNDLRISRDLKVGSLTIRQRKELLDRLYIDYPK